MQYSNFKTDSYLWALLLARILMDKNKRTLVFATANRNKLIEAEGVLGEGFNIVLPADLGYTDDVPETHLTIRENGIEKAQFIWDMFGRDCFADDTGLEVDALDGAPGVFSARYAGEPKNPVENVKKLLRELEGVPFEKRTARFRCVVALFEAAEGQCSDTEATPGKTCEAASSEAVSIEDTANNAREAAGTEAAPGKAREAASAEDAAESGRRKGCKLTVFEGICEGHIALEAQGQLGFGYDPVFIPEGMEKTMAMLTLDEKNAISHRGKAMDMLAAHLHFTSAAHADSTSLTDSTDSTDTANPADPADPSDPSGPAAPADLANPADPSDPAASADRMAKLTV